VYIVIQQALCLLHYSTVCLLSHVSSQQIIENYVKATEDKTWRKVQLLDVWEVDRNEAVRCSIYCSPLNYVMQDKRFGSHDHLVNRRLLWHGTNVAVVAAILKSGLRIMPHSGGRVGKGIYFASENSKSAGYGE